jgi:NADH-quinone oxidoreductase subunit C
MTPEEIFRSLQGELGEGVVFDLHPAGAKERDAWFQVAPGALAEVCRRLRDAPGLEFDSLECVTGVDYPDLGKIVVVYHLYSYARRHRVVLKAFLDRESPALPTLVGVFSAANWQERECFDLLGVRFEGHPDLRRLLLPEDWVGHPLRKDYEEQADYRGIPTARPNPIELLKLQSPRKEPEAP